MSDASKIIVKVGEIPDQPFFIRPEELFTGITSQVVFRRDMIEAIELNDEFVTIRYKQTDG
jgi:hypothetical protein